MWIHRLFFGVGGVGDVLLGFWLGLRAPDPRQRFHLWTPLGASGSQTPLQMLRIFFILCAIAGCSAVPHHTHPPESATESGMSAWRAAPAVVRIVAGTREGSGFFIDSDGSVLTAAHVVRAAPQIVAYLHNDPTPHPAHLIGYDEPLDIALLRIDATPTSTLALVPTAPSLGVELWTIGHPDGEPWSISRGILSRVDPQGRLFHALPVSAGSSGGPLLRVQDNTVSVVGLISRAKQSAGGASWSVSISADAISNRLPDLRAGARNGWTVPSEFLALAPQRGPLVHQVIVAKHVHGQSPTDHIEGVTDTLTFPEFPAAATLNAWTTWRHFFTGQHTYRYRITSLSPPPPRHSLRPHPHLLPCQPRRQFCSPSPNQRDLPRPRPLHPHHRHRRRTQHYLSPPRPLNDRLSCLRNLSCRPAKRTKAARSRHALGR